jgi:predicted Zn-dependent peptidase
MVQHGRLVYGNGIPTVIPSSGTGYSTDIASLSRDEMLAWHRQRIRPDTATLMIVGDTTLAEITPMLEKHFGSWKATADKASSTTIPTVAPAASPRVFLIDQPGAIQTNIVASQLAPPSTDAKSIDFDIANFVLGGTLTSRLEMNVREGKHWAY